jgi:adenylate kinase
VSEPAVSATGPRPRTILLLIGAVASGKGTQADALSARLGIPHLASGDLFRAALREGTPLGERAKTYMDSGELVPDDVTIDMFMEELGKPQASRGAILDGFPRTVAQAEALDQTLAARGEKINTAMYIEVPSEELVSRVAGRSVCPVDGTVYHDVSDPPAIAGICDRDGTPLVKRDDDRPEVVRERLAKQVPPMLDVVKHYEDAGVLRRINGQQPIDAVTRDIGEALG